MANTGQRVKKGKQQSPHSGHRRSGISGGGGGKDDCIQYQHLVDSSVAQSQFSMPGVYSNPDLAHALVGIVGCVVDVQMQSGKVYQGVLRAVSPQLSIALALAHDKAKKMTKGNTERLMQLEFADIISFSSFPESNPNLSKGIFKTDAEISHSNGPAPSSRELQPFSFDEETATPAGLNDGTQGWSVEEMFAINKSKFNVESSYDKEMTQYTTKLDRSDTKVYQQREERATKLAYEMEVSSQRHQKMDNPATEEELFSAVVRHDIAPSSSSSKRMLKTNRGGGSNKSKSATALPQPHNGLTDDSRPTFSNPDTQSSSHSLPETHSTSSFITSTSSPSPATEQVCSQSHQSGFHHTDFLDSANPVSRGTSQGIISQGGITNHGGISQGGKSNDGIVGSMEAVQIANYKEGVEGITSAGEGVCGSSSCDLTSELQSLAVSRLAQEQETKTVPDLEENVVTSPTEDVGEREGSSGEATAVPVTTSPSDTSPSGIVALANLTKDREKNVKQFVLNPAAKQFELNPNAKEFVPPSLSSLSSPLHFLSPMLDPPLYCPPFSSSHTTPSLGGKRNPKQRVQGPSPSAFSSQDPMTYVSSASRSYIMSQTPQQMPSIVRSPLHQGQSMQFSQQYPPSSYLLHPGLVAPQQIMNSQGQKFIEDINAPMFAGGGGGYPVPMAMPQHLLQQPLPYGGGQILPSVSQPGITTNPASLVNMGNMPTAASMNMMLVHGGLSAHPGATPTTNMYPHMVIPQVGQNQATNADMMGQYY